MLSKRVSLIFWDLEILGKVPLGISEDFFPFPSVAGSYIPYAYLFFWLPPSIFQSFELKPPSPSVDDPKVLIAPYWSLDSP